MAYVASCAASLELVKIVSIIVIIVVNGQWSAEIDTKFKLENIVKLDVLFWN